VFCELYYVVVFAFFLSGCKKFVSFCFLCSDDEDPPMDAGTAPFVENITADEPSVQEAEPAMKSPKAPRASINKVPVTRSTKRSKKSKEANISLEAHESAISPHDVSDFPPLCFLRDLYTHVFFP
jgi:hypothetical protein